MEINVIASLRISFSVTVFSKGVSSHKEGTRGTKSVLAQFLQVVTAVEFCLNFLP